MSRFAANFLTVLIAAAVLLAGTLFSSFVLPAATEDDDGKVAPCEVEINTPQEIIRTPSNPVDPQAYFPWTFSTRVRVAQDSPLQEPVLQLQRTFLTHLRDYLDILYGLKIDSLIMEKYTSTWALPSDRMKADNDGQYVFFSDLLFTDASGGQWRITAAGYSEEILYVSCYQEGSVLPAPPDPVRSVREMQLEPMENYGLLSANYQKIVRAFERLKGKLYSLESMFPGEFMEAMFLEEMLLADPDDPVVWSMECCANGKYLLAAISSDTFTPVCYAFLHFQQEAESGEDFLRNLYTDYHGYSPMPYEETDTTFLKLY